ARNESVQRRSRIRLPRLRELLSRHARNLGEQFELVATLINGLTDALHGLRHRRTASLSLDAHGGHGGGDAHHVTLGEARLSARASETLRHLYDLRLCGREVVAEPDDSGTETADIALRSAHDV